MGLKCSDCDYEAYAEHPEGIDGAYRELGLDSAEVKKPNSLWATKAQVREYMAQAWDEGALLRARTHPSESVQELNPYRGGARD